MKKLLRLFGIFILLLAIAHVALNIIWSMQLRNTLRDLKAQGKLKTIEELKPQPVPNSENACLLYQKAFDLMAEGKGGQKYEPNKNLGRVNDTNMLLERTILKGVINWDEKTKDDVRKIMNSVQMKKIFSLIEKGTHKPRCRYNVVYDDERKFIVPFMFVRHAAKLFYLKAQLENDGGNINQSLKTILTGLKMSGHLMDEPSGIAQVIRTACDSILLNDIQNRFNLKKAHPKILKSILNELTQHTDTTPFVQSHNWSLSYITDRLLQGKVNLRDQFRVEGGVPFTKALYVSYLGQPAFKKDVEMLLYLVSTTQESYALPYYKIADKIKISMDEKKVPEYCILTHLFMPSERATLLRAFRYSASLDVARTALALVLYQKTHGSYPDRLDNLVPHFIDKIPVDTFSGKSLVYKKSGSGFLLYSLGPNMKNDDGSPLEDTVNMDAKGDIVWKSGN